MNEQQFRTLDQNNDTIAEQLASKYVPYWPVFLIALVFGLGAAYVYLRYTVPIYQAEASIIIKDERKGNEDSKLTESLDLVSSKKNIENEIEILKSRNLMLQVVKEQYLYAPVYIKGRVHNILAYSRSPITVQAASPDSLEENGEIFVTLTNDSQNVVLNNQYNYPLDTFISTPYGKLKFTRNVHYRPTSEDTGQQKKQLFFALYNPENVATELIKNLTVEPSNKLSSIIDLSFQDPARGRAENILKNLLRAYGVAEVNNKNKLARNTLSFVEERLKIVANDLDSIERRIQQYKSGKGAVDVSTQGQLFLKNVSENDQKLSDINMQLSVLDQVQMFVSNVNNAGIVPSALGVGDPSLSQLIDKLYNYELEYEKLKTTVGENNPTLVAIRDQINKIKPSIIQNIASRRNSLIAAKSNLSATNGGYNSILQTVPQKERQLLEISREQVTKGNIYSFLLQKREESELAYSSSMADHLVVDDAKSIDKPVSPNKLLVLLVAIGGSIVICFLFITVKETFTGKILYRHEVESRTSIPIIGEVAYNKSKTLVEAGTRSFIAEEFRRLRQSLTFLGIDKSHKKILITSSISGEGKSFIAVNLAVSLSLTGKKVVIVDMDLNNPTVGKILELHQENGITEFLEGTKQMDEIIEKVERYEGLYYISAGNIPENPTELLINGRVEKLLDLLNEQFDLVVVDTSPIVLVTDAYILSPLCNATLYIVRHNYTPKVLIRRMDDNNHVNPINNPAIIFNGVKMKGFFKNNYGYGYDYVYSQKSGRKTGKRSVSKTKR
ncbi:MAG TPA: polysaccharide biosynthesis tyrosine autokinase [Flavitalea sp.]|nr:polysaccharide biosynthesis tyrosine autokinase [Flavitalea sp.]